MTDMANIAAALVAAQKNIGKAIKDSSGYNYNYADLEEVIDTVKIPLLEQGIVIMQCPETEFNENGKAVVTVKTILLHTSGEAVENKATVTAQKTDAQSIGSAITYARRYSLQAILCLATADDDGAAACQNGRQSQPRRKADTAPRLTLNGVSVSLASVKKRIEQLSKDELIACLRDPKLEEAYPYYREQLNRLGAGQ